MNKKTKIRECDVNVLEDENGFIAECEELDIECHGNTPEEALEELKQKVSSLLEEDFDFEIIFDSLKDRREVTVFPISQIGDA
jgi:predicted RNase H-like HicB family nuclease